MDAQLNKNIRFILTLSVIATACCLQLLAPRFSVGMCLFSFAYVAVVLVRDYVLKIDMQRMSGILFLSLQLALASVLAVWSESFVVQSFILILVGEFTFYHSKGRSILFMAFSYCCCVLSILIYRGFPPFDQIFYLMPRVIEYAGIFGISLLAKIAFQQKNRLAADNEQLRIASIELERKAKLQERTRISREIHDSVGHTLTSALTGLQTASHAIEKNHYPLAKEMIDRTRDYILSGLDDVRSSVHLLHDRFLEHPFVPELVKLIEDTRNQTQVDITYEIDPELPDLAPLIELAVYRALQEGLSNGIRHGSGTRFRFSLAYRAGLIRFILSDNGRPPSRIVMGFGLNAMKERVEDLGGTLSIGMEHSGGGVTLDITIPIRQK